MGIWRDYDRKIQDAEKLANINIVLSAYGSVLAPIAYTSLPITSGRRFYEVLEKYGVNSIEGLAEKNPDALYIEIIKPNIAEGTEFAKTVTARTKLTVIAPCIFEAKKQRWSQDEYMYMWLNLIENRVEEMHMMHGWEYSNGGTEEFLRGMELLFGFGCEQRNVHVFDHTGAKLSVEHGMKLIVDAIIALHKRGFSTANLSKMADKLYCMSGFFMDYMTSREEWLHGNRFYVADWSEIHRLFDLIKNIDKRSYLSEKSPACTFGPSELSVAS